MLSYIPNISDADRASLPFKQDGKDKVVLVVNDLDGIASWKWRW
jgi:hypothetical protein